MTMYGIHNGLLTASTLLLLATSCGLCAESAEQDVIPLEAQSDTDGSAEDGGARLQLTDADMDLLAAYLGLLLQEGGDGGPLVYVEDGVGDDPPPPPPAPLPLPWKRSRYYRRYPWKRQNGRGRSYRADDNRYMCNPSREDVFQLLVALHEARAGNTGRTVSFCNRRRPASAIFTNIRFLGRRRK